jgi:hypothetical protein
VGGVYGAQLAYFPELFQDYDVFSMRPNVGAGYSHQRVVFRQVSAYLSRNKGGKESVVTELRTENQQASFYCDDELPQAAIKQGLYVEDSGELYQFVVDNSYVREGGFVQHGLQLVTGNNEKQTPHMRVNLGLDEFK